MKKTNLIIILMLLSAEILFAQQQLTIQITSKQQEALTDALVLTLNVDNNSLVNSATTDSTGQATIHINTKSEYVKVMAFGFKDYDVRTFSASDTLHIELLPVTIDLDEVMIRATPHVVQKNDRLVLQVTSESSTKGRTSHEFLKLAPMLQTNQSDMIEIVGKEGVELYINNRKTMINENEIHAYLSTLPADRIATIEVITNPGVTMRTGGRNKGIINLILKKNDANGMNGSFTINDRQGRLNSPDAGLYLNYQKEKLNVSANASVSTYNTKVSEIQDFYFTESNIHQLLDNENKTNNISLTGMIRADYNISDNQTLGLAYSSSYQNDQNERNDITQFGRIREAIADSLLQSKGNTKVPIINQSINLNYWLKTSKKGNLSVDVYYLHNERKQTFDNSTGYPSESIPFDQYRQKAEEPMNSYSGKIEYAHTFGPGNMLTFGTEAYRNSAKSDFFYGNMNSNGIYESDPQKSNYFKYSESYAGAYVSYLRVWNAKFNSRVEVVGEYVESKGIQRVTDEEIVRNDYNILPTVSLMYQANPANRVAYNFSTMVTRPGFYSLNPFRFYITPTTYKEYNPNLKPARMYLNTLNYTLKGHYIFLLNYAYAEKVTNNFLIPVEGQYTKYINANYGTANMLNGVFIWNQSFWKNRVPVNASISGTYQKSEGAVETIVVDTKGFFWNASVNTGARISDRHDWSLTSQFTYFSKTIMAQENMSERYMFSIGMRKNFKNNISLSFGVNNLLFKLPTQYKVSDNYAYYTKNNNDLRQAYIGLTIPFGNMKAKGANNRNALSSKIENRLKE